MKRLSTVQRFLDSLEDINHGGCGISALSMFRWLKKNNQMVGDESFTLLYTIFSDTYDSNDDKIRNNDENIGSCSHVMLYHNKKLFDSIGNDIEKRYVYQHRNITEHMLLNGLNYGSWNRKFDRKFYIPIIEKKLGIDLSDVRI